MTLSDSDPTPPDAVDDPASTGPAATVAEVRCFGIRHHGPGCARSLQRALSDWQPDCLLIEGPPDAEASLLAFVGDPDLKPPVALLVYSADSPDLAAFYPFAEFSPEWQALRHGQQHGIPTRFIDLPQAVRLAQQKARQDAEKTALEALAADTSEEASSPSDTSDTSEKIAAHAIDESHEAQKDDEFDLNHRDPLDALAQAAGFADGESWWNHLVEERGAHGDSSELFTAIAEAMTVLRQTWPNAYRGHTEAGRLEEAQREAHMRQCMREAQKAGHQRIAVVCGAWHVPALVPIAPVLPPPPESDDPKVLKNLQKAFDKACKEAEKEADKADKARVKTDAALLKGLPKLKVQATWVPWTYAHLARSSGYGAGIEAPGWYDFLWHLPTHSARSTAWLSRIGRLLREQQIDCSSAHLIEAIRLSDTLAALRGLSAPGLMEMDEAVRTTIFMGDSAPLRLIHEALTVSQRLGHVPAAVPSVPLQRDLEQQQKALRLKPEALEKVLELDLRNATDLGRSQLLHRLRLLGIPWGRISHASGKGTFKESWALRWEPELSVQLIEASRYGSTVAAAASARVIEQSQSTESLAELANLIDEVLLADLEVAVHAVSATLQSRAATTGDALQLIAAVPPLARVFRYGSVRQMDGDLLAHVLDGLITRGAIGLALACQGLDEEAATALRDPLLGAHEAIQLHAQTKGSIEQLTLWHSALMQIAQGELPHPLLRGLCCRLLLDGGQWDSEATSVQLSRQLSAGAPPLEAAQWLEGFLNRNAMVLLHNDTVWCLVDVWLEGLSDEHFVQIVPLVRRSFATFSASERHDLGQRAVRGREQVASSTDPSTSSAVEGDPIRAALALPLLRLILGVPA